MNDKVPLIIFFFISYFSAYAEESPLDDAPVLDTATYKEGEDYLVILRVEDPAVDRTPTVVEPEAQKIPAVQLAQNFSFQVVATTYGDQATRFEIKLLGEGEGKKLQGWSNLDWTLFTPRHRIKNGDQQHSFLLFHSKTGAEDLIKLASDADLARRPPQIPEVLPSRESIGARYLLNSAVSGADPAIETILDFLEALHVLHDEKAQELKEELRLKTMKREQRKHQILVEKNTSQTRALRVWRLKNIPTQEGSE